MAAAKSATIISDKYLNKMRLECDPLADDAVLAAVRYHGERVLKCHELYSTIKELGETYQDPSCSRFLEFYEHEPPWNVDWEKCDSGRRFFVRNSAIAGLVLMYCSLVKSFTAAFGNKVSLLKLCISQFQLRPNPPGKERTCLYNPLQFFPVIDWWANMLVFSSKILCVVIFW